MKRADQYRAHLRRSDLAVQCSPALGNSAGGRSGRWYEGLGIITIAPQVRTAVKVCSLPFRPWLHFDPSSSDWLSESHPG